MLQFLKTTIIFFCISIFSQVTCADPWFTGPILAPAGRTVPRGHTNFELYGLDVNTNGQFNNFGSVNHIPLFASMIVNPLLTHGFTDWLDIQLSLPYAINSTQHMHYDHLADVALGAGFQLVEQKKSKWFPDLRFFVQETFPTRKFEQLNPDLLGVDATGLGTYRTQIAVNVQYLAEVFNSHYLRTRLILSRLISSSVHVTGANSFGGTKNTDGTVHPGPEDNIDLAFEFTLTQNWVAVMEGYISKGQSTNFNGILDIVTEGATGTLSSQYYEYGLAPAIEYNFTDSVGVIGGVWFPVRGKNTSEFITYVVAINAYW